MCTVIMFDGMIVYWYAFMADTLILVQSLSVSLCKVTGDVHCTQNSAEVTQNLFALACKFVWI